MGFSIPTFRNRLDRMRYFRSLPWRRAVGLFAAVFCTFATIGFVADLIHVTSLRPPVTVLANAAMAGAISCAYLAVIAYWRRWVPVVIAGQILVMLSVDRILPHGTDPHLRPPSVSAIERHATFDGIGCLVLVVLGYSLFIGFISREGLRRARLDTEIGLARDIHARLVPPIARTVRGLELWGQSAPSTEVGGDLVDVLETSDGVRVIVADVAGHGVSAGTLMAMLRATARARASTPRSLEDVFEDMDQLLIDLDRPDKFATAAGLQFGPDRSVVGLLAGHLPVLRIPAGARAAERFENARPPLGLPAPAPMFETRANAGDLFVLLTDGLTEVTDRNGRMLGLEALEALAVEHAAKPLADLGAALFDAARRHGPSTDDQTLLLVRAV